MSEPESTMAAKMAALRALLASRPAVRVLVVDDSPEDLDQVRANLLQSRPGMQVDTAKDVAEGAARLRAAKYDFAIVDLRMPAEDGVELVRRFGAQVPVVAISGLENGPLVDAARDAGAVVHIRKGHLDLDMGTFMRLLSTPI